MKRTIPLFAVASVLVLIAGTGVAFAEDGGPGMMGGRGPQHFAPPGTGSTTWSGGGRPGMHMGSTTEHMGSTTWAGDDRPGMRFGSTTGMKGEEFRGVPGLVTGVDTGHFTIDTHGMGKATTTLTVNVSNSTTYVHGSTTASYADIIVGARVEVIGKLATTSKTIVADRIVINGGQGRGPMGEKGNDHLKNVIDRLKSIFHFGGGSSTGDSAGGPAALGGNGVMDDVLHTLFGWIR